MYKTRGFKKWIIFRHNEDKARERLFDVAAHKRKMRKVNAEFHMKFKKYEKDVIVEVAMERIYKRHYYNIPRHQVTTEHIQQCCSIGIRGIELYGVPLFTYSAHNRRRARCDHSKRELTWAPCGAFPQERYNKYYQILNEPTVVRDYFC